MSNRVGFFGTFAAYAILAGLTAIMVRGLPVTDVSNVYRIGMVLLMIVGMRSTSARVHTALFVIAAATMFAFIFMFQFRLA
jgi:hypothetical protein